MGAVLLPARSLGRTTADWPEPLAGTASCPPSRLRETYVTLPTVRKALGDEAEGLPSPAELEHADAAWDAVAAIESAEAIVRGLGETRFELLQRLEAAPDEAWERPVPVAVAPTRPAVSPIQLDWVMLHARQHELEHLAAIWRVALYWDRASPATVSDEGAAKAPRYPANRLEESH